MDTANYFCDKCSNLYSLIEKNNKLYNYCDFCEIENESNQRILLEKKQNTQNIYITKYELLNDILYPEIIQYCKECKKDTIMKYFEDENKKKIMICKSCKKFTN